jgi:hypothetical protein
MEPTGVIRIDVPETSHSFDLINEVVLLLLIGVRLRLQLSLCLSIICIAWLLDSYFVILPLKKSVYSLLQSGGWLLLLHLLCFRVEGLLETVK